MHCKVQGKVQYNSMQLAEEAMLYFYLNLGSDCFGRYKCPYCYKWHLTSEYDNRSTKIREEFRVHEKRVRNKKSKAKKKEVKKSTKIKTALKGTLPLSEQKRVLSTLDNSNPQMGKTKWWQKIWNSVNY